MIISCLPATLWRPDFRRRMTMMKKVWLIASGKGGVGKSSVTANLAAALCHMGKKVCIIDGDIGLRDQDALLGLENQIVYDLIDVINKDCELAQALVSPLSMPELSLLPAAQFARCSDLKGDKLLHTVNRLRNDFDFILIDCPAGIEKGLRNLCKVQPDACILICTPDDICIRNAERVIDLLSQKGLPRPLLLVNRLDDELIRSGEQYSATVTASVLDLPLLGELPEDRLIYRCQLKHMLFAEAEGEPRAAIRRIACRLRGEEVDLPAYGEKKKNLLSRLFSRKLTEVTPFAR